MSLFKRQPRQEFTICRVRGTGIYYPLYTAWVTPWCGCPGWYLTGLRQGTISRMDTFVQAQNELARHKEQHEDGDR